MRLMVACFATTVVLFAACAAAPAPASAADCRFVLGFGTLHDLVPGVVGECLENERHNTANGNTEQRTTAHHGQGGLLVWRKADNWTAFTDGHQTWINGPQGLRQRLNSELFQWERQLAGDVATSPAYTPPRYLPPRAPTSPPLYSPPLYSPPLYSPPRIPSLPPYTPPRGILPPRYVPPPYLPPPAYSLPRHMPPPIGIR